MEKWIKILDRKILDRRSYAFLISCILIGFGAYFLYKILTLCALGLLIVFFTNEARFSLVRKNTCPYVRNDTRLFHKILFALGWSLCILGACLCLYAIFEEFMKR